MLVLFFGTFLLLAAPGFVTTAATNGAPDWWSGLRDFLAIAVPLVVATAAVVTVIVKQGNLESWMTAISGRLRALQDTVSALEKSNERTQERLASVLREFENHREQTDREIEALKRAG